MNKNKRGNLKRTQRVCRSGNPMSRINIIRKIWYKNELLFPCLHFNISLLTSNEIFWDSFDGKISENYFWKTFSSIDNPASRNIKTFHKYLSQYYSFMSWVETWNIIGKWIFFWYKNRLQKWDGNDHKFIKINYFLFFMSVIQESQLNVFISSNHQNK